MTQAYSTGQGPGFIAVDERFDKVSFERGAVAPPHRRGRLGGVFSAASVAAAGR